MSASKSSLATFALLALLIATPANAVIMITSDEVWDGIQNPHAADGVTLNVTGTIAAGNWVATYTIPQEVYIAPGVNVYLHDISNTDTTMDLNWNFTGSGGLRFGDANSTIDVTKGGRNLSPSLKVFTLNMNNNPISGDAASAGRIINGIYVLGATTGDSLGVNINAGTAPVAIGTVDVSRDDAFSAAVNVTTRGHIDIDNIGTADPNTGGGSAMNINITGESMTLGNFNGFQNRTSGGSQANITLRALGQPQNSVGDFTANTLADNTITLDGLVKTNGMGGAGTSNNGNLVVNAVKLTLAPTFALDLNEGATFVANVGEAANGFTQSQMFVNNSSTAPTTVNYTVFHDNFGPAAVSWVNNASGNWATATNWTPNSAPNANNMIATIGSAVTSPQTIFLNSPALAKGLVFDTTSKVAVAGPSILTLEASTGSASLTVNQGSHELQTQLTLNDTTNASAAAGTSLDLNGVLNLNGQTLNISGSGQINVNNTVTGLGSIVNGGGLGTGGATGLSGNLTSTGTLDIDVGGGSTNSFDSWAVTGNAVLSGVLSVDAVGGFTPAAGQTFTVLTASSVSAGSLTLGGPDASMFSLIKTPTSLVLQAIGAGVNGDHNEDGIVNAADYVLWRKNPAAHGSASGYTDWRQNFGSSGSGSGAGAVPEPTSMLLVLMAGLTMTASSHRPRWA
jgi:hypothetical protein